MAIEDSAGGIAFSALPRRFIGTELRKAAADDVIVHESAQDLTMPLDGARKRLEQNVRTIRNSAYRLVTGRDYKSRHKA